MKRGYGLALGAAGLVGLGAVLMYFLDPKSGARRRTEGRDRTRHSVRVAREYVTRCGTDVTNHTRGLAARLASAWRPAETPTDDVLVARVRSRIGHVVSRPVEVKAEQGRVSLSGTLPCKEVRALLKTVAAIRGVTELENHLAIQTATTH